MLGEHVASEPADGSGDQRGAALVDELDPLPETDRRNSAGEVLREGVLSRREQADPERAGPSQQLVEGCVPPDREADQGRVEREGDECPER